jgi:hypothetical protein
MQENHKLGLYIDASMYCADDPSDSCYPNYGDADCIGICTEQFANVNTCGGIGGWSCPGTKKSHFVFLGRLFVHKAL